MNSFKLFVREKDSIQKNLGTMIWCSFNIRCPWGRWISSFPWCWNGYLALI
jgi:hypothetical protein